VSAVALTAAVLGIAVLVAWDIWHRLIFTAAHPHLAALPLCLIGVSYLFFQLSIQGNRRGIMKAILLGIAFVLWGAEQLMKRGRVVTVMDEAVVAIFVIDVGVIIWDGLKGSQE